MAVCLDLHFNFESVLFPPSDETHSHLLVCPHSGGIGQCEAVVHCHRSGRCYTKSPTVLAAGLTVCSTSL